jgi:hypothetical protein
MFVTHLLFSSPTLRFSTAQKKAVLSWAKTLNARGVPSLDALKKAESRIRELVGDPTEKIKSSLGNVFYLNDIGKAIAKVFSTSSLYVKVLKSHRITQTLWLAMRCWIMQSMGDLECLRFTMDLKHLWTYLQRSPHRLYGSTERFSGSESSFGKILVPTSYQRGTFIARPHQIVRLIAHSMHLGARFKKQM